MDAKKQDLTNSIGLLALRVGFGGFMATFGYAKLQMYLAGNTEFIGNPIGLGAGLSTILVIFAEFVCPVLVAIGLGTRFFSAPIVFTMLVAAFVAHADDPFTAQEAAMNFIAKPGPYPPGSKQGALVYGLPFLALIFTGAGRLSLDGLINWPRMFARLRAKKAAK